MFHIVILDKRFFIWGDSKKLFAYQIFPQHQNSLGKTQIFYIMDHKILKTVIPKGNKS